MKTMFAPLVAALLLAGCDLRYALLGFPQPVVQVAGATPIELEYREAKGGLVVLRGRVNGKADVDYPRHRRADLFRRFVVEIDPAARRVRLHEPAAWTAPQGAAAVPMAFRGGHPFVEARITLANGRTVDSRMNVDTGMNRALTIAAGSHPSLAMPAGGTPRRSCYVNGVRDEREGAALSVSLGGASIPVAAPVYSASPNAVDGAATSTIGAGLFKDRRLIIDYPGKRLFL